MLSPEAPKVEPTCIPVGEIRLTVPYRWWENLLQITYENRHSQKEFLQALTNTPLKLTIEANRVERLVWTTSSNRWIPIRRIRRNRSRPFGKSCPNLTRKILLIVIRSPSISPGWRRDP